MKKIIFAAATAMLLLIGSATALADGPGYSQMTGMGSGNYTSGSTNSTSSPTYSSPTTSPSQTYQARVDIQNFAFTPANLTVWQGTSVIWTNHDNTPHTVTSNSSTGGQPLNSGPIQPGQHYGFLFGSTGTFAYHCSIHPFMTGTITVVTRPAPAPTPPPTSSALAPPAASSTPSASAQSNATATVNNYNNTYSQKQPAATTTPPAVSYSTPSYTAPAVTYSKGTPATTVLPNTGPAGIVAMAAAATVAGTGIYYIYLFMRKRLSTS